MLLRVCRCNHRIHVKASPSPLILLAPAAARESQRQTLGVHSLLRAHLKASSNGQGAALTASQRSLSMITMVLQGVSLGAQMQKDPQTFRFMPKTKRDEIGVVILRAAKLPLCTGPITVWRV